MAEKIKVTQEELDSIKKIQEDYNKKIVEFGQLAIQIFDIEQKLNESKQIEAKLKDELNQLRDKESSLAKQLSEKYGNGKLDINTGLFERVEK